MNENIAQEILHELFSSLEALETQSTAVLQFLKDKGIANEEELARYFEQAGNTSSVRWRAVRVRIDYLLSSAMKTAEEDARKESPAKRESPKTPENSPELRHTGTETFRRKETEETEKDTRGAQETHANGKPTGDDAGTRVEKDENQEGEKNNGTSKPAAKNAA
jgi:hypothetical protein